MKTIKEMAIFTFNLFILLLVCAIFPPAIIILLVYAVYILFLMCNKEFLMLLPGIFLFIAVCIICPPIILILIGYLIVLLINRSTGEPINEPKIKQKIPIKDWTQD